LEDFVAKYHGRMLAEDKTENFNAFLSGSKMVMIATKAFGMGIDIPDIANVIHYAPTGNVCDYMQEIGRAARDKDVEGHAIYEHMENDFQHINRLHGLSCLDVSQLVKVQDKILELYDDQILNGQQDKRLKKRNEMLIDTECLAYIFDSPNSDDDNLINKVKTAMLLIQKDYENRGIAPYRMRPSPLFVDGYLVLSPKVRDAINAAYKGSVELKSVKDNVCKVNLRKIWERSYQEKMSFPKFKYFLYSGSEELDFNQKYSFYTAMSIDVKLNSKVIPQYERVIETIKDVVSNSIRENRFYSAQDIISEVHKNAGISRLKAESIVNVILAAMRTYMDNYASNLNHKCMDSRLFGEKVEIAKYKFNSASNSFFRWIDRGFKLIVAESQNGTMYVSNEMKSTRTKEMLTILGVLEAIGVLTFKSLGGTNSQIYIYMASSKNLRTVHERPEMYRNRLLETISKRHADSVKMLSFLFESGFSSDEIWEYLENYFVGILPDELKD
jgi:ATP-dependent DNA helicase RecQ